LLLLCPNLGSLAELIGIQHRENLLRRLRTVLEELTSESVDRGDLPRDVRRRRGHQSVPQGLLGVPQLLHQRSGGPEGVGEDRVGLRLLVRGEVERLERNAEERPGAPASASAAPPALLRLAPSGGRREERDHGHRAPDDPRSLTSSDHEDPPWSYLGESTLV